MKKAIPISIISLLAIGAFVVWLIKPSDQPPHETGGWELSSLSRPEGVATETLIQSFKQNGFETVDGKTFDDMLRDGFYSRGSYADVLFLRDTTINTPCEFFIGIGQDTITLGRSPYDVMGADAIADLRAQFETRSNLVKELAARQK
jgi:hypothetical protein